MNLCELLVQDEAAEFVCCVTNCDCDCVEMHRTQSEFEDQLIFKVFVFQFVNFYSSIIYIGFFKGKSVTQSDVAVGLQYYNL